MKKNMPEANDQVDVTAPSRKTVLIAILGTAPAVLTEAVWAFAEKKGVVPDRVVVMTTAAGKDKLKRNVLESGIWARLKADLAAAGHEVEGKLVFNEESDRYLMMFTDDKTGESVEDLPTREANLYAANQMMDQIRGYTEDRDWRVFGLMAGGRKTMTGLFFSVMSLLARRGDQIYHVLVSEPFENPRLSPLFYYPCKGEKHMLEVGGKVESFASASAVINLFDVPFVCIGEWAERKCRALSRKLSYENLIAAVGNSMDSELMPRLEFDFGAGDARIDGSAANLAESEFMFCVYLSRLKNPDAAQKELSDLLEYLDDAGSEEVDECACTWIQKFLDSDIFLRFKIGDHRDVEKSRKNDRYKVLSRLKEKLVRINPWFSDEDGSLRLPPYGTIGILNDDQVHPEIKRRMLKGD